MSTGAAASKREKLYLGSLLLAAEVCPAYARSHVSHVGRYGTNPEASQVTLGWLTYMATASGGGGHGEARLAHGTHGRAL